MRVTWILVFVGAVFFIVRYLLPVATIVYVDDAKKDCESAMVKAVQLPLHEINRLAQKTIDDGCGRANAIVDTVQKLGK